MLILPWAGVMIAGLLLAIGASRLAVHHATSLAVSIRVPPFVIGITLIAVGTDLPEIANSIVASLAGHGDINLGDSVGSALTQATLILGLLPLIGGAFAVGVRRVLLVGGLTVAALGLGVILVADAFVSRSDALILMLAGFLAWAVVHRYGPAAAEPEVTLSPRKKGYHAFLAFVGLALVGLGSALAVMAFINLSELLEVPEYLISFFAAALGTSLPELLFNVSAIRKGQIDLAVGDILGSSLVDATFSIGIGPLLAPVAVSAGLAIRGGVTALAVIGAVTILLSLTVRHTRSTGVALILTYLLVYWLLLVA